MTDVLDANPRAVVGDNKPPLSPYEAHVANFDNLLTEAHAWADGAEVENEAQDAEVKRLIEEIRLAIAAADASRVEENKPFDDGKAAVQAKYNEFIADTKTAKGSAVKAMDALKATRKPYLDKLEKARLEAVEAARVEAQRIADEAAKARAAAPENDLGAIEAAEALTDLAEIAAKTLKVTEAAKVTGLRKTYTPVITDRRAAILHYMNVQPDEFVALVQRLAEVDVRAGKRRIPGFEVREGTKL